MKTKEEYRKELLSADWAVFRRNIIDRDNHQCMDCKNRRYIAADSKIAPFVASKATYGNAMGNVMYNQNENVSVHLHKDDDIWQAINDIRKNLRQGRHKVSNSITGFMSAFAYVPKESASTIQALFRVAFSEQELDELKTDLEGLKNRGGFDRSPESIRLIADLEPERITWYYARMLNVHHLYYQDGLKAWQYPASALKTLCLACHHELHTKVKIPVIDRYGLDTNQMYTPCHRCGGAGWFPEYRHRDSGICYECSGARYVELAVHIKF